MRKRVCEEKDASKGAVEWLQDSSHVPRLNNFTFRLVFKEGRMEELESPASSRADRTRENVDADVSEHIHTRTAGGEYGSDFDVGNASMEDELVEGVFPDSQCKIGSVVRGTGLCHLLFH